ncbi:MAG: ATP-binding protein [Bacteroidota bacterium]
MRRVVVSWSSGKDAAWTLWTLRQQGAEVVGLLTSLNAEADRVAMHGVRRSLVEAQAAAVGLPLHTVELPWPCSNAVYEARMATALSAVRDAGATHIAFGDLFLADVRAYRERQLRGTGLAPLFPLWGLDTARLASDMLGAGLEATLTCVDPSQVDGGLVGRPYDRALLAALPDGADACGENGEFHTFCWAGPMFERPIPVALGEVVERDGFRFADVRSVRRP